MKIHYFTQDHFHVLDEAAGISEEVTSDFFHISSRQWMRMPYEVRTLRDLRHLEHPGDAFAHLVLYGRPLEDKRSGRDSLYLYRICLHDDRIVGQTGGGELKRLLPFLVYILTHELVHIIRFSRYDQSPLARDRVSEEHRVHQLTHKMLRPIRVKGLPEVLKRFSEHEEPLVIDETIRLEHAAAGLR